MQPIHSQISLFLVTLAVCLTSLLYRDIASRCSFWIFCPFLLILFSSFSLSYLLSTFLHLSPSLFPPVSAFFCLFLPFPPHYVTATMTIQVTAKTEEASRLPHLNAGQVAQEATSEERDAQRARGQIYLIWRSWYSGSARKGPKSWTKRGNYQHSAKESLTGDAVHMQK